MAEFQRAFFAIDTENTKKITVDQLRAYMKKKNYKETFMQRWITLFDPEHTGIITFENYCATLGLDSKRVEAKRSAEEAAAAAASTSAIDKSGDTGSGQSIQSSTPGTTPSTPHSNVSPIEAIKSTSVESAPTVVPPEPEHSGVVVEDIVPEIAATRKHAPQIPPAAYETRHTDRFDSPLIQASTFEPNFSVPSPPTSLFERDNRPVAVPTAPPLETPFSDGEKSKQLQDDQIVMEPQFTATSTQKSEASSPKTQRMRSLLDSSEEDESTTPVVTVKQKSRKKRKSQQEDEDEVVRESHQTIPMEVDQVEPILVQTEHVSQQLSAAPPPCSDQSDVADVHDKGATAENGGGKKQKRRRKRKSQRESTGDEEHADFVGGEDNRMQSEEAVVVASTAEPVVESMPVMSLTPPTTTTVEESAMRPGKMRKRKRSLKREEQNALLASLSSEPTLGNGNQQEDGDDSNWHQVGEQKHHHKKQKPAHHPHHPKQSTSSSNVTDKVEVTAQSQPQHQSAMLDQYSSESLVVIGGGPSPTNETPSPDLSASSMNFTRHHCGNKETEEPMDTTVEPLVVSQEQQAPLLAPPKPPSQSVNVGSTSQQTTLLNDSFDKGKKPLDKINTARLTSLETTTTTNNQSSKSSKPSKKPKQSDKKVKQPDHDLSSSVATSKKAKTEPVKVENMPKVEKKVKVRMDRKKLASKLKSKTTSETAKDRVEKTKLKFPRSFNTQVSAEEAASKRRLAQRRRDRKIDRLIRDSKRNEFLEDEDREANPVIKAKRLGLSRWRLRPSLRRRGAILILLAGTHRGKRVVLVGRHRPSGLLLVTGPLTYNGCPLRRVHPDMVIATKTRIELTKDFKLPRTVYHPGYFTRASSSKGKNLGDQLNVSLASSASDRAYQVSDQRKNDQAAIDSAVIDSIKRQSDARLLIRYLKSLFSLGKHDYPHKMIF